MVGHTYLAVDYTALLVNLFLIVIVDAESLEEDLILVGRHGALVPHLVPLPAPP